MQIFKWWLLLLAPVCGLACSSSTALSPVEGKVVVKGQPVEGVVVTFHPQGADPITAVRPIGLTKGDGTFALSTGTADGAAAGAYLATFIWPKEVKAKSQWSTALPDSRDEFEGTYADASRSDFKVEIKKGSNKLEPFVLK